MEFLNAHQLNIMLFMSGICGILAFLSYISKSLSPKRRRIMTLLESAAPAISRGSRSGSAISTAVPKAPEPFL